MTTVVAKPSKDGFAANEPVVVASAVAWLFSVLGTFILGHTDLISAGTWSGLTTTLVPIVSALVLTGIAWVTRHFVTPAWKAITHVTENVGLPDEVLERLVEGAVVQELTDLKAKFPEYAELINKLLAAKTDPSTA